jgi:hypothetical protein
MFVNALLARLTSAPLCAGARRLRLQMPVDWIDRIQATEVIPATLRLVFVCDSPPAIKAAQDDFESIPIIDLGRKRFMNLFNEIMAPENLGLGSQLDINKLASLIWHREPIEGVEGYEGFAVLKSGNPIGVFLALVNQGEGARLGFAGLLPRIRRRRLVAATIRCVVDRLDRIGAFPMTMEIDLANRRSIRMAERRCGMAKSLVGVYDWPLGGT